jgi:hypothetical protein
MKGVTATKNKGARLNQFGAVSNRRSGFLVKNPVLTPLFLLQLPGT